MSNLRTGVAKRFRMAGFGLAALGVAFAWSNSGPDALLERSYSEVLTDADTSWSTLPSNIWLSRVADPSPGLRRTLSVGDRIAITGRDGRSDAIEIVSLEQIDGDGMGLPGVQFQLVTGRSGGQLTAAGVRFLFAVDAPDTRPATPKVDKSL